MKLLTFALVATTLSAAPLCASAQEPTLASPAARTAALLALGTDLRIAQIQVEINPRPDVYRTDEYRYQNRRSNEYRYRNHNRRYHTQRVVYYRHGVRHVTYRRVYDR